jgi:hypothetical protein
MDLRASLDIMAEKNPCPYWNQTLVIQPATSNN